MTTLREAATQALGALEGGADSWQLVGPAIDALKAALAEPALQTCNCRWDGEMQMQQCTLHEAHVDAIKEWAQRAKFAEKKLAALAEQRLTDMEQKMERSIESLKTALAEPVQGCPSCEYNKQRAQLWRNEAYKLGGHPLDWEPELMVRPKPLTEEEILSLFRTSGSPTAFARAIERAHGIT